MSRSRTEICASHRCAKNTPESAEVFAENAYALMPHVKITELLAEVDQWTNLGDQFLHLRTQAPPKTRQALLTAVLADGINLGLTRMSEACRETSWRQLSWTADWHVREECYAQALAGLIDAQHRLPLAAHWGSGTTSSSDAQFFRAGGAARTPPAAHTAAYPPQLTDSRSAASPTLPDRP
jgi:hypothetical protein